MIQTGKESTAKLNDQERVIALRKYFKIDNLLRVPAVLQTLIDPPPKILEEKPYQALAMLNKFDAAAAEYKKREGFTAGPLNQGRLKEILPALSAVKEAGKSIKQAQKALEQRGIIIRFTTRSKNSLFYAYIKKLNRAPCLSLSPNATTQTKHYGRSSKTCLIKLCSVRSITGWFIFSHPPRRHRHSPAAQPKGKRPVITNTAARPWKNTPGVNIAMSNSEDIN